MRRRRSYGVAFGDLRTDLQLGFIAFGFPLGNVFVAGELEIINLLLHVGLCGFQLSVLVKS